MAEKRLNVFCCFEFVLDFEIRISILFRSCVISAIELGIPVGHTERSLAGSLPAKGLTLVSS
jgi:hypothetical protein